ASRRHWSETEYDIGTYRPSADVRTSDIRSADADPLNPPELSQKIQHHTPMELVEVRLVQAISQAAVQARPPVVAARAQLVTEQVDARRDVDIDHVGPGSGSDLPSRTRQ